MKRKLCICLGWCVLIWMTFAVVKITCGGCWMPQAIGKKIDTLELKLARVVARIEIASALRKRLASDICLDDLREKAKE